MHSLSIPMQAYVILLDGCIQNLSGVVWRGFAIGEEREIDWKKLAR